MTTVKSAAPTPKSLPSSTGSLPTRPFEELTSEEAMLRQRLEMKAERALLKAAVGLRQIQGLQQYDSTSQWLSQQWGNKQKVEEAMLEAMRALHELCERRLFRSTHYRFDQYLCERFGWSAEEIYPAGQIHR
ncbi:MAG: hypothetical protein JO235_26280 [Chroococcidiopsidaceae cyanobacterium CP_BM_RX_35]|nr:hypothetical protein [Chroococcidiopsidaceae cyanobacterium CP_BM_RX_35]